MAQDLVPTLCVAVSLAFSDFADAIADSSVNVRFSSTLACSSTRSKVLRHTEFTLIDTKGGHTSHGYAKDTRILPGVSRSDWRTPYVERHLETDIRGNTRGAGRYRSAYTPFKFPFGWYQLKEEVKHAQRTRPICLKRRAYKLFFLRLV
jgi:hypothetical protein